MGRPVSHSLRVWEVALLLQRAVFILEWGTLHPEGHSCLLPVFLWAELRSASAVPPRQALCLEAAQAGATSP